MTRKRFPVGDKKIMVEGGVVIKIDFFDKFVTAGGVEMKSLKNGDLDFFVGID
jgi:hypothetical protein